MSDRIPNESLAEILRVEGGGDRFTASLEDFWGEPMGADVWARTALAAARSVPDLELLSLQGYLRPWLQTGVPLVLEVETREETPELTRCDLRLRQAELRGRAFASFAAPRDGPTHQDVAPSEPPPDPETLPSSLECARTEGWPEIYARGPIEFRRIGPPGREPSRGDSPHHLAWLKPRAPLPRDAGVDTAALVLAAGWYPHWEFERRIGPKFAHDRLCLADLALHVHAVEPWSDWWLLEARNEVAREGRALSSRRLFSRDGRLLASASAQALVATLQVAETGMKHAIPMRGASGTRA